MAGKFVTIVSYAPFGMRMNAMCWVKKVREQHMTAFSLVLFVNMIGQSNNKEICYNF